jgi:hypothetical protein
LRLKATVAVYAMENCRINGMAMMFSEIENP